MTTATQIITRAMRLARVIGKGETPDADESADGLQALNTMLDSWQIKRLFVYQIREESFTWAAKSIDRLVCRNHCSCSRCSRTDGSNRFGADWVTPVGKGQKLCVELILMTPSSTARITPGSSTMRMPWLSSACVNPRSAISRNIA